MSQKSKIRAQKREQQQERQARRVVNGIFIAFIVLALGCLVAFAMFS